MNNVISFPYHGKPIQTFNTIKSTDMHVKCIDCGNTKKFYGRALTNPFIMIERSVHSAHSYEVTEIGYSQSPHVQEQIEQCAACGSANLDINILKEG